MIFVLWKLLFHATNDITNEQNVGLIWTEQQGFLLSWPTEKISQPKKLFSKSNLQMTKIDFENPKQKGFHAKAFDLFIKIWTAV